MNIHISGNLHGPTVFFLAGWPDSSDVFRTNLMASLSTDYRIVGLTLPGFDADSPFFQRHREEYLAHREAERRCHAASRREDHSKDGDVGKTYLSTLRDKLRQLWSAETPDKDFSRTGYINAEDGMLLPLNTLGYSFQDLVMLLEIAVDAAMESHNYCPATISANALRKCSSPARENVHAHQHPPSVCRPVFIAHDWGCLLMYELLLSRPTYFSRVVALDVGASLTDIEPPKSDRCHRSSSAMQPPFLSGAMGEHAVLEKSNSVPNKGGIYFSNLATGPRSLASKYAIRTTKRKPPGALHRMWFWFCLVLYQGAIVGLFLFAPTSIASLVLRVLVKQAGRPSYTYNPRIVFNTEAAAFNRKLYFQYYRGMPHYPTTGEGLLSGGRGGGMTPYAIEGDDASSCSSSIASLSKGWDIVMTPLVKRADDDNCSNAAGGNTHSTPHSCSSYGMRENNSEPVGLTHAARRQDDNDETEIEQEGRDPCVRPVCPPTNRSTNYFTHGYSKSGGRKESPFDVPGGHSPYYAVGSNEFTKGSTPLVRPRYELHYVSYFFPPSGSRPDVGSSDEEAGERLSGQKDNVIKSQVYCKHSLFHRVGVPSDQSSAALVEVHSRMGWIYLRYWWGALGAALFSWRSAGTPPRVAEDLRPYVDALEKSSRELYGQHARDHSGPLVGGVSVQGRPSPSRGKLSPMAHGVNGHLESERRRHAVEEVLLQHTDVIPPCRSYSPLVSQRYWFPISVPILYMYGGRKAIAFHSEQWCSYVQTEKRAEDGISDVVEVPGAGHWFFAEQKYQKKVAERVCEFLRAPSQT